MIEVSIAYEYLQYWSEEMISNHLAKYGFNRTDAYEIEDDPENSCVIFMQRPIC